MKGLNGKISRRSIWALFGIVIAPIVLGNGLAANPFESFCGEISSFFDDWRPPSYRQLRGMMRTDVKRTATEYVIEMEMPGIRKEDINLRAEGQTLCISIHPSESREGNKSDYVCRERFVPAVDRCLSLPDAKIDGAKAKLENGVLTIKVARQDENENVKKIVIE